MIGTFISVGVIMACVGGSLWYHQKKLKRFSFKESMDLLGMPVITFNCGNRKLNFLLDTGSNISHVVPSVVEGLKCEKIKNDHCNVQGIAGSVDMDKICTLELTYLDKAYPATMCVSEHLVSVFSEMKKSSGCNIHGLLGSDFFNTYKYVLDFNSLTAYAK